MLIGPLGDKNSSGKQGQQEIPRESSTLITTIIKEHSF